MHKILTTLLGIFIIFFISCSKPNESDGVLLEYDQDGYEEQTVKLTGVFLIDGPVYELRSDGQMHWYSNMHAGDVVNWIGEKREAIRAFDGQRRNFYSIEMDGDFWVHDYFIFGPGVPAVIINEDAAMYSRPELAAVIRTGTVTIPRYSILALVSKEITGDFTQIAVHIDGSRIVERFIRNRDVSLNMNDIESVKLVQIAAGTQNANARRQLLNNAIEFAEKGSYFRNLPARLNNDPVLFELEMTNNLEDPEILPRYRAGPGGAPLMELPLIDSPIRGTLNEGDWFWAYRRTKKPITLSFADNETEKMEGIWLATEEGLWVFSAYVELLSRNSF